jgi:hypothetical protein
LKEVDLQIKGTNLTIQKLNYEEFFNVEFLKILSKLSLLENFTIILHFNNKN